MSEVISNNYSLKEIERRITFSGAELDLEQNLHFHSLCAQLFEIFDTAWSVLLHPLIGKAITIEAALVCARAVRDGYQAHVVTQSEGRHSLFSETVQDDGGDYELPTDYVVRVIAKNKRSFRQYCRAHNLIGCQRSHIWAVLALLLVDEAMLSLNRRTLDTIAAIQLMAAMDAAHNAVRCQVLQHATSAMSATSRMVKFMSDPETIRKAGLRIHIQKLTAASHKTHREVANRGVKAVMRCWKSGKYKYLTDAVRHVIASEKLPITETVLGRHVRAHIKEARQAQK